MKHYIINVSKNGRFFFEVTRLEKEDIKTVLAGLENSFLDCRFSIYGIPYERQTKISVESL